MSLFLTAGKVYIKENSLERKVKQMKLEIVQDLLLSCADEEIIEEVIKKEQYKNKKKVHSVYTPLLTELRSRTAIPQEDVIFGVEFIVDGETSTDALLYSWYDLEYGFKRSEEYESISDINAIPDESVEQLVKLKVTPNSYSYEYLNWDIILGYKIDKHNAETFGKARLFANILSEMTFFGLTEDAANEAREKLKKVNEEINEIVSLTVDERAKIFLSWEEVKASLGIEDEPPAEKKVFHKMINREILRNKLITYNAIKDYTLRKKYEQALESTSNI